MLYRNAKMIRMEANIAYGNIANPVFHDRALDEYDYVLSSGLSPKLPPNANGLTSTDDNGTYY